MAAENPKIGSHSCPHCGEDVPLVEGIAPDFTRMKPLVLVGKVSLRSENRLTCFSRECGKVISAPDHAWFFRRRTRGGLGVVIYCDHCKEAARFDHAVVYHYPEEELPPAPKQPPTPSRFIRAAEQKNLQRCPPPKPQSGIWRPEWGRP